MLTFGFTLFQMCSKHIVKQMYAYLKKNLTKCNTIGTHFIVLGFPMVNPMQTIFYMHFFLNDIPNCTIPLVTTEL